MDRKWWAWATFILVGVTLFGLVLDQGLANHSVPSRTDEERLEAVHNGVYEPEIIVFATLGYDAEVINGRFLDPTSPGLEYLTYLIEGSVQYPSKVDFCQRVYPKIMESYRILDQAFGRELTEQQTSFLGRIKDAYATVQARERCPQGNDSAQQVST